MGRGKGFNHKEKGNPGNYTNKIAKGAQKQREQVEPIDDIATYEAFKNRLSEEE
ncbi:hypothetical protein [Bacillus sp. REN10]|uniref:hypothetical protein n=1 Tax=Bacillus sp. REN10 TaxID=2782541 RepID=UPI00193B9686|nr:hypothetical protein [Bacillus sp. REN10]